MFGCVGFAVLFPSGGFVDQLFWCTRKQKKTSWGRAQKIKYVQQEEVMFLSLETVWHCVWTKKDMTAATKLGFFSPLLSFGCVIKHKHNQSKDGNNYGKPKYSDSKLTHSPLRQTHKSRSGSSEFIWLLSGYSAKFVFSHWRLWHTPGDGVVSHDLRPLPRILCLTLHDILTADWPPHLASQGSNYNQTHQIQAHYWATETIEGNALILN